MAPDKAAPGPLDGVRVIEFAGLGAVPFCGMLLADWGADVVRVDRPESTRDHGREVPGHDPGSPYGFLDRGRRSIAIDLKHEHGVEVALALAARSEVLIEGLRPGVMERLGLGPERCRAANPALVYGRVTGWGQDGPRAGTAGHDVNFLALSGALYPLGPRGGPPLPPLNLLGDHASGGMLLASSVLAALFAAQRTGRGDTIDAAMVDGAALMTTHLHGWRAAGTLRDRGESDIDGGSPFYGVYRTADDRFVSVGAGEPVFFARLLSVLGIDPDTVGSPADRRHRDSLRDAIAARFATRTRAEWCDAFASVDTCFAPVLEPGEAPAEPHLAARGTFVTADGLEQPAPSPRFTDRPAEAPRRPPRIGQHTGSVLSELGIDADRVSALRRAGVVGMATDAPSPDVRESGPDVRGRRPT